ATAPLLRARWSGARDRLAAARLVPALPQRRLASERQRFDALARLYDSLDPEAPLQRGFVLVKDAEGHLVRSRALGAAQPLLSVKFADGILAVVPQGRVGSTPPPRKAKNVKSAPASAQDDLFG
ncbi:exodeoxyribonuclease VII large subunit, partial [Pseudopontixanthobacter vadosimaris]|uniref:exodeoxyribonuclease VII large subunit n=1 Tax=Pseudopontixanthobacter vadosimaris TaxID=2726450 RepID=UPI0023F720BA